MVVETRMILANEIVAKFFKDKKIVGVFRTHKKSEDEKFKQLMGKLVAIDGDALKIVMGIKEKELKDKKDSLREINKHFCKLIATNDDNSLCDIYNETSFKPEYRFLSAYKERLFAKLNNFDTDNNYTCAGREEEIKNRI